MYSTSPIPRLDVYSAPYKFKSLAFFGNVFILFSILSTDSYEQPNSTSIPLARIEGLKKEKEKPN